MSLSEVERQEIFRRAGGRCECRESRCGRHAPGERCGRPLGPGFWDVARNLPAKGDEAQAYLAMCAACLEETGFVRKVGHERAP